ncbi:MAG: hypothetical protein GY762_13620 [Proteobacteria bacterium]|nr:hypothetical protein [Pseudomonadota bacterium]
MFYQIKKKSLPYRVFYYPERLAKEILFNCHMCGQCILRSTAMICPMQCPKQLRNGPCGGSMDGMCEVFADKACIWAQIYDRADRIPMFQKKLATIQPTVDWSLIGTSAWLNIWPDKRTDSSGHALAHTANRDNSKNLVDKTIDSLSPLNIFKTGKAAIKNTLANFL